MLRFLCPLYANKSHQRHILLRITGYKWAGTRLVTRYVATVHGSSLATCSRVTVLTCLTPHVCSSYSVTAGSPGDGNMVQMVQVSLHTGVYCDTGSLHTGVYCDTGSLCTGVYRGWWCGRGEGGPGTDPLLTVRGPALTAAPPPAPPQTLVTSHSGECPTSTLQSTMLFDDRQFCFNISG